MNGNHERIVLLKSSVADMILGMDHIDHIITTIGLFGPLVSN